METFIEVYCLRKMVHKITLFHPAPYNIPVTIFLFTKDNLYMSVLSWKSIFDSVEPLHWNCTAIVWATLGPAVRVNLALNVLGPLNEKTKGFTLSLVDNVFVVHKIRDAFILFLHPCFSVVYCDVSCYTPFKITLRWRTPSTLLCQ